MTLTSENILLVVSVMLFLSIFAGHAGFKFGVPSLLLFLGVGMFMGSAGVGFVFDNFSAAQFVGVMALCIILFAGGMDTRFEDIKPVWKEGVSLATLGVALTALFTGCAVYSFDGLFGVDLTFAEAMLLASVMASTDSASVFSVLRSKGLVLSQNLRPTLELESGSNDPMAYLLTIALIQYITTGSASGWDFAKMLVWQIAAGAILGVAFGFGAARVVSKIKLNSQSLYPVLLVACVIFIFAFTDRLGGNGYLAVYLAGLCAGNSKLPRRRSIVSFFASFTWLWQILMFMTLGLLVNPKDLPAIAAFGLCVGAFMVFVGRPLAVLASLLPFRRFTLKARAYISWVGLKGAVPIIFATYPVVNEIPHADIMFNTVFFITIVSLIVQGTSVPFVARLLGVGSVSDDADTEFYIDMPDDVKSAFSEVEVTSATLSAGNTLSSMKMPPHTLVILVRRAGRYFVPRGDTPLQVGDTLLVMSDSPDELAGVYERLGLKNRPLRNE